LIIDLSSSTGTLGRPWNSLVFDEVPTIGDSTAILQFLHSTYESSPPTAIPSDLLTAGAAYVFTVSMCNFLGGCSQAGFQVVVLTTAVPVVSIKGPALRTVFGYNELSLGATAYMTSCEGNSSSSSTSGLSYTWRIFLNSAQLQFVSTSIQPSSFTLPAQTLTSNFVYNVQVTVFSSVFATSAVTSTDVFVQPGNLVVSLSSGGDQLGVRSGESFTLDASSSYDQDLGLTVTGIDAGLSFAWSCVQISPALSSTCPLTVTSATDTGTSFVVAAIASGLGTTAEITVVISSGSRSASTTVSMLTQ